MSCEFDRVEETEGTEREAPLNGAEAQQEARGQRGASEEHDGASNAVCSEADAAELLPPDAQEETMDAAEPAGGDSSRPADVRRTTGASIDLPSGVELVS